METGCGSVSIRPRRHWPPRRLRRLLTPDEKGDAVKRIAIILGVAAAVGVFPSVAGSASRARARASSRATAGEGGEGAAGTA
jgi:hypothetical protein